MPRLEQRGLTIALEGDEPARLAICMDAQVVAPAYRFAAHHRCPLIHYVWDLPPWRLGAGRPDWIWFVGGQFLRIPRSNGYPERRGYYSRLSYVAHRAREVWVPSAATRREVEQRLDITPVRVPYCFDSDRFASQVAPRARGTTLLCVSRLTPQKRHADVIRAAARFDPKLPVRIIGTGEERERLQQLAVELGVTLRIEGGLSDADVLDAYREAGVVVAPSIFEGFGLTPMEGIACGLPVVASDIPTHREFLGDAPHYFPPQDVGGLVAAIERARAAGPPSSDGLRELTIDAAAERFYQRLRGRGGGRT